MINVDWYLYGVVAARVLKKKTVDYEVYKGQVRVKSASINKFPMIGVAVVDMFRYDKANNVDFSI